MSKIAEFMKGRIVHPQEIEVWYAIPAIRREIAKEMKKKGLEQKEIAKLLGITEAAVSYYFGNKRGGEIKFSTKLRKEVEKSVDNILKNNNLIFKEVQRILNLPEIREQLCNIHHKCKGVCNDCSLCGG